MENPEINSSDIGSLEKFKRRLERAGAGQLTWRTTRLPLTNLAVESQWSEPLSVGPEPKSPLVKNRWLLKFFVGALFFFLATVAVAVYILFLSGGVVSGRNIDLEIKGPTQLPSGGELNLETTIRNRNKVVLRDASLIITYPVGTVSPTNTGQELRTERQKLTDFAPGQSLTVTNRAVIFGPQNSQQLVKVTLEYHLAESNAVFTRETNYQMVVGTSPLTLSLIMPSEINIGKVFSSKLKIISNAQTLMRRVAVKIDYPAGFNFESAEPSPLVSNNVWFLGDLAPGSEREINLIGSLIGQSEEIKSFKVMAGLDETGQGGEITIEYGSLFQPINLKKDFVSAVIDLGGQTAVTPSGQVVGNLSWVNHLPDKIINGELELVLAGSAIDKRTVSANSGFYDSLTNTIKWNKNSLAGLGVINPGEGGQTNFRLLALSLGELPADANMQFRLVFRGTRITAEDTGEEVETEVTKNIKIGTLAQLATRAIYSVGPFRNTGPLPPKVGEETTYTITWSINNSTNEIKNGRVRVILPIYVRWLSMISPLDEKIIYNKDNREVVWDLGAIAPGTIAGRATREVSFQVAITPSLSQVANNVNLTEATIFTGIDAITGQNINLPVSAVNTRLTGDPSFIEGQDKVIE